MSKRAAKSNNGGRNRLETAGQVFEILNKVIVSCAVLVGGGWAFYKYVIFESPTAQVAVAELKRYCSERGSLDIKIEADTKNSTLIGKVIVKNIGTRLVDLHTSDPSIDSPLTMAKIEASENGELKYSKITRITIPFTIYDNSVQPLTDFSVLPGRTLELYFIAPVPEPGAYLISFLGGRRNTIPDDDVCKSIPMHEEDAIWAAATIHWVENAVSTSATK